MSQEPRERLRFDVLTLFPDVFGPVLGSSILGIARSKGLVGYYLHDIRHYSTDKHRKVDDRPYGGGPGMVIQPEPVFRAWEDVRERDAREPRLILLTPQGRRFDQKMAAELAAEDRIALLCGHYEGFDERVRIGLPVEELSIGDYVLSAGETAALVVIDAVVRLVPGVLGDETSPSEESFSDGLLEYPHYTRPPEFRGMEVPEVLLSGHHEKIRKWRQEQAARRTKRRRADLLAEPNAEQNDG